MYMSAVVLVYGTGAILGPVIGGSLADSSPSGWRWVRCGGPSFWAIIKSPRRQTSY